MGGSGKSVGKTSLICSLIGAMPERQWTAIKITSHVYGKAEPIWEETAAGEATDTERYLAAGARRALLVEAPHAEIGFAALERALRNDENLLFESNAIVESTPLDLCLAVIGGPGTEAKPSFAKVLGRADACVTFAAREAGAIDADSTKPVFRLSGFNMLSPEMLGWLRGKLDSAKAS